MEYSKLKIVLHKVYNVVNYNDIFYKLKKQKYFYIIFKLFLKIAQIACPHPLKFKSKNIKVQLCTKIQYE